MTDLKRVIGTLLFSGWLVPLAGCGGTDFGGEVQLAPAQEGALLDAGAPDSDVLNLPADRPFNIHMKNSSQNPGVEGKARGDSDAEAAGRAFALAEAAAGGTAQAEFRIGQRIVHAAARNQRAVITVEFKMDHALQAPVVPDPKTLATINLQLMVLDARKHVLARMPLVQTTTDEAVGSGSAGELRNLSVILEPSGRYDIMLYGQVESVAAPGQEAIARLDVGDLRMRLSFSPMTTQPGD
ncbi:MAG: hypothetical protein AMXMBFR13_30020 [Phycisphaerae bacterium]